MQQKFTADIALIVAKAAAEEKNGSTEEMEVEVAKAVLSVEENGGDP
ncbi:MAG: hypothetical protein ACI9UK_001221 [Candidatus Krumholzibacteriia bacterium]|jgi:hypothetical protein